MRTIAGTLDLHLELERRLAAFKGVEVSHHLPIRFFRQPGDHRRLVGKEDVIFSDELNHASIIDGSRLSGARIVRYAHCDPADLERGSAKTRATTAARWRSPTACSAWMATSPRWIRFTQSPRRTV